MPDLSWAMRGQSDRLLGQANTLQSLGDLERRLGRPVEARALYEQALGLFEQEQSGLGQANTLQSLGDLERQTEDWQTAIGFYRQALDLYVHEQTPVGLAYTFAELARCLHALNRETERDNALCQALRAADAANVESVRDYVMEALHEMMGGAAPAWLADNPCHE